MAFKVMRVYLGGYTPNYEKLRNMGYAVLGMPRPIVSVANSNQGLAAIKGTVKRVGNNYAEVPVCCFRRSNRTLLWEVKSQPDGSYFFRNIAPGLECFIVAFDPNNEYNAVISDKVVAK